MGLFASPSHTSVGLFALSVGPSSCGFAPIAGPHLPVFASPRCPVRKPLQVGLITLGVQRTGQRSAGNPPAPFDGAGAGNVAMVERCTQRAIARARLETLHLPCARPLSTQLAARGGGGRRGGAKSAVNFLSAALHCFSATPWLLSTPHGACTGSLGCAWPTPHACRP